MGGRGNKCPILPQSACSLHGLRLRLLRKEFWPLMQVAVNVHVLMTHANAVLSNAIHLRMFSMRWTLFSCTRTAFAALSLSHMCHKSISIVLSQTVFGTAYTSLRGSHE